LGSGLELAIGDFGYSSPWLQRPLVIADWNPTKLSILLEFPDQFQFPYFAD